jgi:RimJ/RimL family protein N-acetyltransferase
VSETAEFETERLLVRLLEPGDAPALQAVFEAAGDYFLTVTGRPAPDADAAARELKAAAATPGRRTALLLDRGDGAAVGALGWWEGHPEPDLALLGMVLVVPERRGEGRAREAVDALAAALAGRGITRLRTGVGAGDTEKHALLGALGFQPLDARTHVDLDRGRIMLALFERPLGHA